MVDKGFVKIMAQLTGVHDDYDLWSHIQLIQKHGSKPVDVCEMLWRFKSLKIHNLTLQETYNPNIKFITLFFYFLFTYLHIFTYPHICIYTHT